MTDRLTASRFRAAQRGLPLTTRHRRALDGLSRGRTGQQLTRVLESSLDGVKHQLRALYARLDARNAAHAVRIGFQEGLLRFDLPEVDPWTRSRGPTGTLLHVARQVTGYRELADDQLALVNLIGEVERAAAELWWHARDDARDVDVDALTRAGRALQDGFALLSRAVTRPGEPPTS